MKDETIELMFFTWGVPNRGYVWEHSARAAPHVGGTGTTPFLLARPATAPPRLYTPLDDEESSEAKLLFHEFAGLAPVPDTILKFANRWGWLGIGKGIVTPSNKRVQQGESLSHWQREILDMKHAVALWKDLQYEDVERLNCRVLLTRKDCVTWEERIPSEWKACISGPSLDTPQDSKADRFTARLQQLFEEERKVTEAPQHIWGRCLYIAQYPTLFKDPSSWNVLLAGKALLADLVNAKLRGTVSACLLLDRKRNPNQYIRPDNLLAAMWVQFSQVIQGQRRIIFCKYCQQPIEITENRRSKKAHRKCVNREKTYRSRWKERIQLLKDKLAVAGLSEEQRRELGHKKSALEARLNKSK